MLKYIKTQNGLTIYGDKNQFTVTSDHENYEKILNALKDGGEYDELYTLYSKIFAIKSWSDTAKLSDKFKFGDRIYFDGCPIPENIARSIAELRNTNHSYEHLLVFFENMSKNPSFASRESLYDFLNLNEFPLTSDGCFLAYKAVRENFLDIYSGTLDNSVGKVVKMEREEVNDNRGHACSHGLHAGNYQYVQSYGNLDSKWIIVKINPRDVVSVPSEDVRKIRVCEYLVLAEVSQDFNLDPSKVYESESLQEVDLTLSEPCTDCKEAEKCLADSEEECLKNDSDTKIEVRTDVETNQVRNFPPPPTLVKEKLGFLKKFFSDKNN